MHPDPNGGLFLGIVGPPQLSELSHQWTDTTLGGELGVLSGDPGWLGGWIGIC
jgi:hypothetical protein